MRRCNIGARQGTARATPPSRRPYTYVVPFPFSAKAAKQNTLLFVGTPSEAVLPAMGCMSSSNINCSSNYFSNSSLFSRRVLLMPPLGLFILPFGVAGEGGKCLRISFVIIIGKPLSLS